MITKEERKECEKVENMPLDWAEMSDDDRNNREIKTVRENAPILSNKEKEQKLHIDGSGPLDRPWAIQPHRQQ